MPFYEGAGWIPGGQEKNYDKRGKWIGAGREPFDVWVQRMEKNKLLPGSKEIEDQEGIEYAVELPGVKDIIHLIPRAKISEEEMKAHRAALRRGQESPLSEAQKETIRWKMEVFQKIMKSPTPPDVRQAGWWVNQVENAGDMMTGAYWGQRGTFALLKKIGLMKRGPAAKYTGWALLAKDIADIVNLFRMARVGRAEKKKTSLKSSSLNPLSTERKFTREFKMKAKMPGVPDWVEIAQITDQFFGIGVSFGPIVGFFSDLHWAMKRGRDIVIPGTREKGDLQVLTEGFAAGANLQQWGP